MCSVVFMVADMLQGWVQMQQLLGIQQLLLQDPFGNQIVVFMAAAMQ